MEMESTELKTAKGPQEDVVKQFSVFMENKVGRLLDIVKMFAQARIHVVALSILDTADAAIVRLVADDPDKARSLFMEHGLAFTEVTLVVVELSSSAADLKAVLTALLQAECVLEANQFKLLTQRDISR
jgi:hypothetical protein